MGEPQQFSLRWNNYVHHITCAFDGLRSDEDLVDVTLSCEGKKIYAHKVMLSACSLYFKDVFKDNPCKHPVIIFRNVKYEDLLAIIDFMYHGEVNVEQEQLSSFLTTAEMLCVQGLSVGSTTSKDESRRKQPVFMETNSLKQNNVKNSSRSILPQNETVTVRTPSPTRKRRLSPTGKSSIAEKRKPIDIRHLKVETEEYEDDGSIDAGEMRDAVDAKQMPPLRDSISPTTIIKAESETSNDQVAEREEGRDSSKSGQAGTSGLESAEQCELVEYLDDEYDELEEGKEDIVSNTYSFIYISEEEENELETEYDVANVEKPILKKNDNKAKTRSVRGASSVEYIYADGFTDNNEIIIGEVPRFQCDECDQSFKRNDSLIKHRMVHRGVTSCSSCGITFSRLGHLKRHIKVKHPDWKIAPRKAGRPSSDSQSRNLLVTLPSSIENPP